MDNRAQDGLRARIRAAQKLTDDAVLRWETLCADAGLTEPPGSDGYELSRAASARLKSGRPLHPTDFAYIEFLRAIDNHSALQLELARRDDPRRYQVQGRPVRRAVDGRRMSTSRTVKINGVRLPVVEYIR